MAKVSVTAKDTPLSEMTLRRYEKPYDLSKRELVRKFCLTVGLLQPGDSRDVIVDILRILLDAKKAGKMMPAEEIRKDVTKLREKEKLPILGVASSNIRRQLKRLRDLFIVEKIRNKYRITEFVTLKEIFQEKIEMFLLPSIIERIHGYIGAIDEEWRKH